MPDVVARLRQLEAAATPGPWKTYSNGDVGVEGYTLLRRWNGQTEDADMTVAARNALPQLLAITEAAQAVRAAAGSLVRFEGQPATPMWRLMEALAALDSHTVT